MRYIINFQIKITDDGISNETIRSSYTILEKDISKKVHMTTLDILQL